MTLDKIRDYLDWRENQEMDFFDRGYSDANLLMGIEDDGVTLSGFALRGICEAISQELSSTKVQRRRNGSTVNKREYSDANRYREGFMQRMRE
jgi:hypothetical protein